MAASLAAATRAAAWMARARVPLQIRHTADAGRYVVASRAIAQNELLVDDAQPYAVGITHSERKRVCAECFTTNRWRALPHKCPRCGNAWFCSPECADAGTLHAREECEALRELVPVHAKIEEDWERTNARLFIAVFARRKREGESGTEPPDGILYDDVAACVTNIEKQSAPARKYLEGFAALLRSRVPSLFASVPVEDIVHVMGVNQCNSFGLWDEAHECCAIGLYPYASYFNHSCEPNLYRTGHLCASDADSGSGEAGPAAPPAPSTPEARRILNLGLRMRALRPVAEGEEVCTAYIDCDQSAEARVKDLEDRFFFRCRCRRCEAGLGPDDEFVRTFLCRACGFLHVPGGTCPTAPLADAR
eukprot:tig00000737_g3797.t1